MSKILVKFAGTSEHEPNHMELPAVPRVGDHMTLNSGTTYRVTRVLWDFTTVGRPGEEEDGLSDIVLFLEAEEG